MQQILFLPAAETEKGPGRFPLRPLRFSVAKERSWRIGSLVLMVIAVAKVFVFDAAGLEGLLRIASFMALGFSLIGIGWFCTRQLAGGVESRVSDELTQLR